jgi:ABC-type oligopeptide transport system substrate-binding subunit
MMKSMRILLLTVAILSFLLSGCAPASTPSAIPSPLPPSAAPATETAAAPPTETLAPAPAAMPGSEVVPLEQLSKGYPWLPIDVNAKPAVYFVYFNLAKPPFDNVLVRQAFAAAVDREAVTEVAKQNGARNTSPATTLTPRGTLGRDLYNVIGIPFSPTHARELLAQAGYADGGALPPVTLLISATVADSPTTNIRIGDTIAAMWKQNLGVQVKLEIIDRDAFFKQIASEPPQVFRAVIYGVKNDPNDFLQLISSSGKFNYGGFSNPEYDKLVVAAANTKDPALRQMEYIQAERILCETQAAILPVFHTVVP